jgi:hypothetical protein
MSNNRIYYACQSVQLNGPSGTTGTGSTDWDTVQGLQSVGMNTNFNLEPIYQMGQLSLYDNYEEIPEVEVTLNKVLDGQPTIYAMAMGTGCLSSLANNRCGVKLSIFPDDVSADSTTTPVAQVECVPAYLSSVTYTFPTEGNFTEEVTLVSNDKTWVTATAGATNAPALSSPDGVGILRRALFDSTSTIPGGLGGVTNITVSMNLGREELRQLGRRTPYLRYVNFPVEITTEITKTATNGDQVGVAGSEDSACSNPKALTDQTIIIKLCDGTVIDLGTKNKLTSVNYTGGDTGGGNAEVTYSYQTFNDFCYTAPDSNLLANNGALAYTDVVESDPS